MRKDVECTFGILKKRFSVLKTGFRLQSIAQCDKVWRTCCALHNLLLFNDGLDKNWETGKKMKTSSCDVNDVIPFAIQRLISNDKCSNNHTKYEKDYFKKYSLGGKRVVSKIPLDIFKNVSFTTSIFDSKIMILNGHKERKIVIKIKSNT